MDKKLFWEYSSPPLTQSFTFRGLVTHSQPHLEADEPPSDTS